MTTILGISAYYHDSAAALLRDGQLIAAAQEERFTRKRHDQRFPHEALSYCLREANVSLDAIDLVAFYDKPLIKFERLLETYLAYAPRGIRSFLAAMPVWLKEKLYLRKLLRDELAKHASSKTRPRLLFTEHHQSHAASAFFPSRFDSAAILCMDGVGEWATTTVWTGSGNRLIPQWQIDFPHSIGLLYSAFTYYTGFKVNSGEYKLMGLAPYGEPKYVDVIMRELIDVKPDGTFRMNMRYFDFATGLTMTNAAFDNLFGAPPRSPESRLTQFHMDLAASIQKVTEDIVLRLGTTVHRETGLRNLCMAGGVALNCVANGRLLKEGPFDSVWVQPAAGDAGGAVGAAFSAFHEYLDQPRTPSRLQDAMQGAYLGPHYSNSEVRRYLDAAGAKYVTLTDDDLFPKVAGILADDKVVGWFQGRMEFGPRALGARSIIGDARSRTMQSVMNLKIKYRESFRPFAPSILAERVTDYFEHEADSPYMLFVAPIRKELRIPMTTEQEALFGIDKLNIVRSTLPSITHVDYSARLQTVHSETNPRYHRLIQEFEKLTGCAVIVNTSFNVRGEPIVCSPEDAYRCFMRTEMDYLVLENQLLAKTDQPARPKDDRWKTEFDLD
jgi:carbamoyltransferase